MRFPRGRNPRQGATKRKTWIQDSASGRMKGSLPGHPGGAPVKHGLRSSLLTERQIPGCRRCPLAKRPGACEDLEPGSDTCAFAERLRDELLTLYSGCPWSGDHHASAVARVANPSGRAKARARAEAWQKLGFADLAGEYAKR